MMPILRISEQLMWHCEAEIKGNRDGLTALRDAIDVALVKNGVIRTEVVFQTDGEGFHVEVECLSDEAASALDTIYKDTMAQ